MLIEFRVKNFRSFRDEQVLSMVASKDTSHAYSHVMPIDFPNLKAIPGLLRGAVVYGSNASGKSNLIRAMGLMRTLVASSASSQLGQLLNCQPFLLDKATAQQPSEFEITFLIDGVRYQYGFMLTAERVHEEWLLVYKAAKPQQWFRRQGNDYTFSSHLTGARKLWQESTRPNALFLSTAVQLNSEMLAPVFGWLVNDWAVFANGLNLDHQFTTDMVSNPEGKKRILDFLASADVGSGVSDITMTKAKQLTTTIHFDFVGSKHETNQEEREALLPRFRQTTKQGSHDFDLPDLSMGTQKLYAAAGPILDILDKGRVLVVDEIDGSLHPLLVRWLVALFHNPNINKHGAQLIFTTHDTSQLAPALLRRDQVWFIDKNADKASVLYPLSDFHPRKGEPLEKSYLIGRFGAVPFFREMKAAGVEDGA